MNKDKKTSKDMGESVKTFVGTVGSFLTMPLTLPGVRALTKTTIKGGIYLTTKTKDYYKQVENQWNQLYEEARNEVRKAKMRKGNQAQAPSKTKPKNAPEDFESWHFDELYEKARQLDIKGRSNMNKKELIIEIRKVMDSRNIS